MIKGEYSPQELKGIIGLCDLFIGSRMHSTIASTSMLIPTVGIAYGHKMHGVLGEGLRQNKYIIDINELTYETLMSKTNYVWTHRKEICKDLKTRMPKIRDKCLLNGKLVKELLDKQMTSKNMIKN